MKAVNLEDTLGVAPFKPFMLHMDKGNVIRVKHPDCVMLSDSKKTAVIADGEHFQIVDLEHISSLSMQNKR